MLPIPAKPKYYWMQSLQYFETRKKTAKLQSRQGAGIKPQQHKPQELESAQLRHEMGRGDRN